MLYIVDTSVLLSDHKFLEESSDKDIILPLVVISELEKKRSHQDLGFAARYVLRYIETIRKFSDDLSVPVPNNDGSLFISMHDYSSNLPESFNDGSNDSKILATAIHYFTKDDDVVILSKDITLRIKASLLGVKAEDHTRQEIDHPDIINIDIDKTTIDTLYTNKIVHIPGIPKNQAVLLKSDANTALGIGCGNERIKLADPKPIFGVKPRSKEQVFALNFLDDDDIKLVSIGGKAGTGKSMLALAAGLEGLLEQNKYKKILIFRPLFPVGGQNLGYLPGDADEKMEPWAAAVRDTLSSFCNETLVKEIFYRNLIEILPLTHIRGRTLNDAYVIFDEVQNYEIPVILTALSRLGTGSKGVMTHDVAQKDNIRIGKNDGIAAVIEKLSGENLFAHMTLHKSERSEIAELVSSLLE